MQENILPLLQNIKSMLVKELHVNIQNDWLSECVNFFVSQIGGRDLKVLYENTKEQLLLGSIADLSNRVISERFFTTKNVEWTFNETLFLQMNFILEISESYYEQWRRMHNMKLDESNPEVRETKAFQSKKKRMFKLELTDGHRTIHAMEMKPIKCLNTKIKPGTKVIIRGPAKVVNAIILLEPQNIQIIGGEVDDLLIINAYENILLKLLRKPTVDNPIKDYPESNYDESQSTQNNLPPVQQQIPMMTAATTNQQNNYYDDDDENIDLELIQAIEDAELENDRIKNEAMMNKENERKVAEQVNLTEVNHQNEVNRIPPLLTLSQKRDTTSLLHHEPQSSAHISKANDLLIPNVPMNNQNDYMDVDIDDIFEINEVEPTPPAPPLPLKIPTYKDDDYAYKIDNYNCVIIDQYVELSKREKMERTYVIQAKIDKVIKLKIENNEWLLLAQLTDPYSHNKLPIRFSDSIVADFANRTAKEMNILREKIKTQPQLKMDITNALSSVNNAIEDKTFLMSVTMTIKLPMDYENVVTNILENTNEAKHAIILKLEDEQISLI